MEFIQQTSKVGLPGSTAIPERVFSMKRVEVRLAAAAAAIFVFWSFEVFFFFLVCKYGREDDCSI
jgi:hypothetical protein